MKTWTRVGLNSLGESGGGGAGNVACRGGQQRDREEDWELEKSILRSSLASLSAAFIETKMMIKTHEWTNLTWSFSRLKSMMSNMLKQDMLVRREVAWPSRSFVAVFEFSRYKNKFFGHIFQIEKFKFFLAKINFRVFLSNFYIWKKIWIFTPKISFYIFGQFLYLRKIYFLRQKSIFWFFIIFFVIWIFTPKINF